MDPAVSVIVCSRNRADSLRRVLEALARSPAADDVEVIAVDNGSTDHTERVVAEVTAGASVRVRYLREPRHGKAFALNRGVASAQGDLLCFTDDDVTLHGGWLRAFREAFRDPACLGAAGRILPEFDGDPPPWLPDAFPFPFRYDFGVTAGEARAPAFGANMAYRRRAFERFGTFREDLGPTSANPIGLGEDSEFCRRLMQAGELVRYVPEALVHHPVSRQQATKGFLRAWHFRLGRAMARREPVPGEDRRVLGAPRHLLRTLLTSGLGWCLATDRTRRLSHSLAFYRAWGQVLEYRSAPRS